MRNISLKQLAVLTLLMGAVVFASGAALGQDHAADPHTQDSHGEPNTTHDEPGHKENTQVDHGGGEGQHGEDAYGGAQGEGHGDEHGGAHGDEHGDAHGDDHHGEGHSSIPHLQNLITGWIAPYLPDAIANNLTAFIDPLYSLFVAFLLALFFIALSRQLDARKPGRRQMAAEMIFGGLYSLFQAIIGPSARRYTPFLGTLFIFILCNNLAGLFPLGHAATSSFNATTFALGALTFLYVQGIALKENGVLGYLHHMAGSPKTGMDWGFSLLLFPLHLLGELIKPVSLSLRLFGNIFGEDTLVATMVILGYLLVKAMGGVFLPDESAVFGFLPGIPLQLPFYFLGLLSSTIQALVFTLLATVYIALWLPHGDHDHAEAHGH